MTVDWSKISIAPMMEITDRRFRFFMRLLNAQVRLYTEMIVAHAIVRGNRNLLLKHDASEHPVTLQLGGDDAQVLSEAAQIGEDFGYDALDLNCGCPSSRVESGHFGVTLMRNPEHVAEIVARMRTRVKIPVSVKCRIGITGEASEEKLLHFIESVFSAGAVSVTIHARTATIGGIHKNITNSTHTRALTPKENREIPPLQYDVVYRIKEKFSTRTIEINGGIKTTDAIAEHLQHVDRVMIGRLAHENPFFFSDGRLTREEILDRMTAYAVRNEKSDVRAAHFFTNMLNLFHSLPNARKVRRFLSEEGRHLSPSEAVHQLF